MPRVVTDYDVNFNNVTFSSALTTSTQQSTSPSSGSLKTLGGVGVALNASVGGNLNVQGNCLFSGSLTATDLNTPVVISKHTPAGGGTLDSYTFNTNSVQTKNLFGMVFFSYNLSINIVVSGAKIALQISVPLGASRPAIHTCCEPHISYLTQAAGSNQLVTTDSTGSFTTYNSGTYTFKLTSFYFTS